MNHGTWLLCAWLMWQANSNDDLTTMKWVQTNFAFTSAASCHAAVERAHATTNNRNVVTRGHSVDMSIYKCFPVGMTPQPGL